MNKKIQKEICKPLLKLCQSWDSPLQQSDKILIFLDLFHLKVKTLKIVYSIHGDLRIDAKDTPAQEWLAAQSEEDRKLIHESLAKRYEDADFDLYTHGWNYFLQESKDSIMCRKALPGVIHLHDKIPYLAYRKDRVGDIATHAGAALEMAKVIVGIEDLLTHACCSQYTAAKAAFEYFVGENAKLRGDSRLKGKYTQAHVSEIMAGIAAMDPYDPTLGDISFLLSVLDPACGMGYSLLRVEEKVSAYAFYGMDKDALALTYAQKNVQVSSDSSQRFQFVRGDSMQPITPTHCGNLELKAESCDIVVCDPPPKYEMCSLGKIDERFKFYGVPSEQHSGASFLLHGLHYLAEKGVMTIALDYSNFFEGRIHYDLRKALCKEGVVDAVITVEDTPYHHKKCILVLKKIRKASDILFINGLDFRSNMGTLNEDAVLAINETYRRRENVTGKACLVALDEIEKYDYSLSQTPYFTAREALSKALISAEKLRSYSDSLSLGLSLLELTNRTEEKEIKDLEDIVQQATSLYNTAEECLELLKLDLNNKIKYQKNINK